MKRAAIDSQIIGVVASNVRAARRLAALSQEELAFQAHVDRTYISQVERRKRNVTISVLARIAKALDVTPDKLLVPALFASSPRSRKRRS